MLNGESRSHSQVMGVIGIEAFELKYVGEKQFSLSTALGWWDSGGM